VGPERIRLAHLLLLTLRGTPTWYYGDELGLPSADWPPEHVRAIDPQAATTPERDRLRSRTPMPWTAAAHGGFSRVEPWLPLSARDPDLTVERQRDDRASTLALVRSLLRLRRATPALAVGSYRTLEAPPGVFSFARGHPSGSATVHLNFGDVPVEVGLEGRRGVLAATGSGVRVEDGRLVLPAFGGAIVEAG
jgi:glycosidase